MLEAVSKTVTISRGLGLAAAVACGLAGCAYKGGIDDPLTRRATWFSYLDGGDIRQSCGPGTIDRYRLVYNGRYDEQVRSYEVTGDGAGGGILIARVIDEANLTRITLDDPLEPWRGKRAESRLSPAEMQEFIGLLDAAGMFGAPPDGLRLKSWRFYWVASGCHDGQFHFSAWDYPSTRWDGFAAPTFLFARDQTGAPVNPPRAVPVAEDFFARGPSDERGTTTRFTLEVDGSGLGGLATID
jgi:hypothetical protein